MCLWPFIAWVALCQVAPEIFETMQGTVWGQRSWELLKKRVSSKCLASILGVRPQRFKSAGSGKLDRRFRCFGAEARRESVLERQHYMSVASA